ncbi:type II 3-dehydroquinate dehydratase [Rickettsiales bacterium]|jgi:3-dehydroquinate dehydratase II|nr:type II 3-dehydroquinate dehydratase [Rickettsiales bacterium]|tara:strand:+ start:2224 stop:2652 length:429 start_codon:yes stop_codon:yes gene_type:complete
MKILIINGPNLNLLHKRDSNIYGNVSLEEIEKNCNEIARNLNLSINFVQSNDEGEIVAYIQKAIDDYDAIIINAAAYTHTSVAIRDAMEMFQKIKIEIHLSNIYKREEFRHKSLISNVVDGVICGFNDNSYYLALNAIKDYK